MHVFVCWLSCAYANSCLHGCALLLALSALSGAARRPVRFVDARERARGLRRLAPSLALAAHPGRPTGQGRRIPLPPSRLALSALARSRPPLLVRVALLRRRRRRSFDSLSVGTRGPVAIAPSLPLARPSGSLRCVAFGLSLSLSLSLSHSLPPPLLLPFCSC